MRLPDLGSELELSGWPDKNPNPWQPLIEVPIVEPTRNNAFERVCEQIREMARTRNFMGLRELLQRRIGARALTWLWQNDPVYGRPLLTVRLLDLMIEQQQPRLTRLTLLQLLQLYFQLFDQLDSPPQEEGASLRERMEEHLRQQLQKTLLKPGATSVLANIKPHASGLLSADGPMRLVQSAQEEGKELEKAFISRGLKGFDQGRYGDVCRAHYFLKTLRDLPLGAYDPVFIELLKREVSEAPFEQGRCIGHAALEILIDRVTDSPGEAWQDFIVSLAGDPRIVSSSSRFRRWWLPLGEDRIEKVRGWLSKEDLRLFLQAIEQYGAEHHDVALQRMFPARKVFLEGLFRLKLIRSTRLMLGRTARASIRKILGNELRTSFAELDNSMADKAVIYLDCGDFHLVEGSHNFKIWSYLALPSLQLKNYNKTSFTHHELIHTIPGDYRKQYSDTPYEAVAHNGLWQDKVIRFLADQGIELDWEELFTRADYQEFLRRTGVPWVNPVKTSVSQKLAQQRDSSSDSLSRVKPSTTTVRNNPLEKDLSPLEQAILQYFRDNPRDRARYAANALGIETKEVNQLLNSSLKHYCVQDKDYGWSVVE